MLFSGVFAVKHFRGIRLPIRHLLQVDFTTTYHIYHFILYHQHQPLANQLNAIGQIQKKILTGGPGPSSPRLEMAFAGRVGIDMKLDDASEGSLGTCRFFFWGLKKNIP